MTGVEYMEIRPQKGAQERFLSCSADICIYGGAAGGGKTFALLLEPLHYINNGKFGAVIFRKNNNQIFAEGGLWDTACNIYPYCGGKAVKSPVSVWRFQSGMKVTFSYMEMEKDVLKWQGSQIPLILFDELTHFSRKQFFYMLSRNRSTCGVKPYVRASCNPDSESWVADFISWWWDKNTGYPIPERSDVFRWFIRRDDVLHWADSKEELCKKFDLKTPEEKAEPKSVTFIASTLQDNKILMEKDPSYMANLKALSIVERERLLYGNWKIKPAQGLYFPRNKVNLIEEVPDDIKQWVRAWDFAATEDRKNTENGAAYTAGVLIGKRKNGSYIIADVINRRMNAGEVRQTVLNTAKTDKVKYKNVKIRLSQDPGQAGKDQAEQYLKLLSGFSVSVVRESGDKQTRAEPFSAQWIGLQGTEKGNVFVLLSDWTDSYLSQLESFPEGKYKDMVDASSNGFAELAKSNTAIIPPTCFAEKDRENRWI